MLMRRFTSLPIVFTVLMATSPEAWPQQRAQDLLYVGVPNNAFANAVTFGGVGIVAFDVNNDHRRS
jgi:hypothetical protein